MRKSIFSLIGAVILSASLHVQAASPPGSADVSAFTYSITDVVYLLAIDQPAGQVPIVAATSHTAVTDVMGVFANWQPGGGNVAYSLLVSKQSPANRAHRLFVGRAEVGRRV